MDESALSGDRLAYGTYKAFGDAKWAPWTSEYLAARGPGGWQSHGISPPRTKDFGSIAAQDALEYWAFSPDLCQGWLKPRAETSVDPAAIVGNYNIYRRSDDECGGLSYEALTTVQPEPAGHSGEENTVELQGLSADGTDAFFAADYGRLTVDAPNIGHVAQVYESSGGRLSFVCVLPDAKPALGECALRHMNQSWGSFRRPYLAEVHNAVSSDGERIWAAGDPTGSPVYMREHPDRPQSALARGGATGKGSVKAGKKTVTSLLSAEGTADLVAGSEQASLNATTLGEFRKVGRSWQRYSRRHHDPRYLR